MKKEAKIMKTLKIRSVVAALALLAVALAGAQSAQARGNVDGPVIYVTGQGLFYDSIVQTMLPQKGPFQKLEMGGPSSFNLQTEFGPGDEGYVGGRWWLDLNGNNQMDDGDMYFSCPLLGPGRGSE
jgi:opacity protein-like surface antigen